MAHEPMCGHFELGQAVHLHFPRDLQWNSHSYELLLSSHCFKEVQQWAIRRNLPRGTKDGEMEICGAAARTDLAACSSTCFFYCTSAISQKISI